MLPNSTSRYGDMLREFYDGIKNNNLSDVRLYEIVRVFNELSERENKYRTWIKQGSDKIDASKIERIPFPVEAVSAYTSDIVSIPNNIDTPVTLDVFFPSSGYSATKQIHFNGANIEFAVPVLPNILVAHVSAIGNWATNATGRRALSMKAFDKDGVEVGGGTTLYSFKASGLAGVPDVYPGVSWILPSEAVSYYKLYAYQNSGGALDLEYAEITIFYLQTTTR